MVRVTGTVAPTPPKVTLEWLGLSYWTELATPVDKDDTLLFVELKPVDNEVTLLLVELRPVDNEVTLLFVELKPVDSELMPVDADVDNEVTLLLVVLRPVDNEVIPVDVVVDNVLSCLTVTASWAAEPSATLVIRRSAADEPIEISESGAVVPVRKPVPVGALAPVTLPCPIATLLA